MDKCNLTSLPSRDQVVIPECFCRESRTGNLPGFPITTFGDDGFFPLPELCEGRIGFSHLNRKLAVLGYLVALCLALISLPTGSAGQAKPVQPNASRKMRVGAIQAKRRIIDYRLKPELVLAAVDKNLNELEQLVQNAGSAGCDAVALPEDTLGLLNWLGMNEKSAKHLLDQAVPRMLSKLGKAAASHHMYLVVCSSFFEPDGGMYNTAFFLGRDGKEIGRYHKVCPTWSESGATARGAAFPVFQTPDLGTVGMLICYDMVFPETARCLALKGADIIFYPTMGGGAMSDDEDLAMQALRIRAVENYVWIVVAFRGSGAMIISPQGKVIAKADGPDGLVYADIDPKGAREGGDSANTQRDMRARLFRERNAAAFGMLTDPNPPILTKAPIDLTRKEAGRIMAQMLTTGEVEFRKASELERAGKIQEAIEAYTRLRQDYRASWIDKVSKERLDKLKAAKYMNL